jgi:hypothetical protein
MSLEPLVWSHRKWWKSVDKRLSVADMPSLYAPTSMYTSAPQQRLCSHWERCGLDSFPGCIIYSYIAQEFTECLEPVSFFNHLPNKWLRHNQLCKVQLIWKRQFSLFERGVRLQIHRSRRLSCEPWEMLVQRVRGRKCAVSEYCFVKSIYGTIRKEWRWNTSSTIF